MHQRYESRNNKLCRCGKKLEMWTSDTSYLFHAELEGSVVHFVKTVWAQTISFYLKHLRLRLIHTTTILLWPATIFLFLLQCTALVTCHSRITVVWMSLYKLCFYSAGRPIGDGHLKSIFERKMTILKILKQLLRDRELIVVLDCKVTRFWSKKSPKCFHKLLKKVATAVFT